MDKEAIDEKMKILLAVMALLFSFTALKLLVKDYNRFFIASEFIHVAGIVVLIYKLSTKKTCSGLSLKSRELRAIFLAVRIVCSFLLEGDIHILLDFATFVFTAWVIFMIRFKLKSTYIKEHDNFPIYYMAYETGGRYLFLVSPWLFLQKLFKHSSW